MRIFHGSIFPCFGALGLGDFDLSFALVGPSPALPESSREIGRITVEIT